MPKTTSLQIGCEMFHFLKPPGCTCRCGSRGSLCGSQRSPLRGGPTRSSTPAQRARPRGPAPGTPSSSPGRRHQPACPRGDALGPRTDRRPGSRGPAPRTGGRGRRSRRGPESRTGDSDPGPPGAREAAPAPGRYERPREPRPVHAPHTAAGTPFSAGRRGDSALAVRGEEARGRAPPVQAPRRPGHRSPRAAPATRRELCRSHRPRAPSGPGAPSGPRERGDLGRPQWGAAPQSRSPQPHRPSGSETQARSSARPPAPAVGARSCPARGVTQRPEKRPHSRQPITGRPATEGGTRAEGRGQGRGHARGLRRRGRRPGRCGPSSAFV